MKDGISNRLGCLTFYGLAGALIVLVGVIFSGLFNGGAMFSPGALNAQTGKAVLGGVASHAQVGQCSGCHSAPLSTQSMAAKCLDCHVDLVQDPNNFHNLMITQGINTGCNGCHTDHRGPAAALTVLNLAAFPHVQAGFSLQAHQKMADGSPFQCSGCHTKGYIGFDQAICTNCHATLNAAFIQGHTAAFGQTCLSCHDGKDTYGKNFNHQKVAFALNGKHSAVTCEQCHVQAKNIADLKNTAQDCNSCHAKNDAHNGQFGQDCSQCHTTVSWQSATFDHSKSAFPLTGAHQQVTCIKCHVQGPAGIVFKGTPTTCVSCHTDPAFHKGLFGADCATCHNTTAYSPATFNQAHAFPLNHGRASTCKNCHPTNLNTYTCFTCHAPAQMASRHEVTNAAQIADCARCHANGRRGGD